MKGYHILLYKAICVSFLLNSLLLVHAQDNTNQNKFRQLGQELPTPNVYRTAAGAPGHEYWQQKASYDMNITLNDANQRIDGSEVITYQNNSPDELTYLWVQLDQNVRAKDSDTYKVQTGTISDGKMSFRQLKRLESDFDGGFKIKAVKEKNGRDLAYTINKTMMRIDLPRPLRSGNSFSFKIDWWYNINDRMKIGGRSGYEYFEADDNYLYTIAQFFPRMAVYNEVEGWQNKQFLGRGEFALPFGDYKVNITVPADHIIAATGTLQNPQVLTPTQRNRFERAKKSDKPVMIVTQDEATANESSRAKTNKTWTFKAENVRDFAFASSRKFIWDAMNVQLSEKKVMAMSFYPKEGNPLWEQYSTKAVAQTLRTYSKHTFDYPYPTAISVHAKWIGMEYPMICFNFGRPESDGTYNERTKYGMIGVIIHEVGHNFFPMIINSDERQWTWMDEGLNTFLQYLTEQEWEEGYPSRRGPAWKIVDYMKGDKKKISPIMTNSESIHQFGNNAYAKPATALNILRETVMGRELFDFAFKEYAQRWMFKHPTPSDFFRTMEDASGIDLDWFWRGWFYTNDHVDIALDHVQWYQIDTKNPTIEKSIALKNEETKRPYITEMRNEEKERLVDKDTTLVDFYNRHNPFAVSLLDEQEYEKYLSLLDEDEQALLEEDKHYYEMKFTNKGGLVMPIILEFTYEDDTREIQRIPAEIWKMNSEEISKIFVTTKKIKQVILDPYLETADTETGNNYWPHKQQPSRFQLYKQRRPQRENLMQRQERVERAVAEDNKEKKEIENSKE